MISFCLYGWPIFSRKISMNEIFLDFIVIGSGPGGSMSFKLISDAGLSVTMLERGDYWQNSDKHQGRISAISEYYERGGVVPVLGRNIFTFGQADVVGGGSIINGGLMWRPPDSVLRNWRLNNYLSADVTEIDNWLGVIEQLMEVKESTEAPFTNLDSAKIKEISLAQGWKCVPARRALNGCQLSNRCGSVCISGAKRDVYTSIIAPTLKQSAAQFEPNFRVDTIKRFKTGYAVHGVNLTTGAGKIYLASNVIVACGPINSLNLLRKSKLIRKRKLPIGFHLNLKVLVKFSDDVNATSGTMFTQQIQEFIDEGVLLMPTNFSMEYLPLYFPGLPNEVWSDILESKSKWGVYTIQIRPDNYGKLLGFGSRYIPTYSLNNSTYDLILNYLEIFAGAFLNSGAEKIYLPDTNYSKIRKTDCIGQVIRLIRSRDLRLSSVHAMSSLPLGRTDIISAVGELKNHHGIFIRDASILPTLLGESPQETIMLLSALLTSQILDRS
jgi:choline dehydrogenase-like flavoprotein